MPKLFGVQFGLLQLALRYLQAGLAITEVSVVKKKRIKSKNLKLGNPKLKLKDVLR